jgi:membrane protease YdiL (CAAX protease family)
VPPPVPLLRRRVLDAEVAEARRAGERPWGVHTWLVPLAVLVVSIPALALLGAALVPADGGGTSVVGLTLTGLAELLLLGTALAVGRPLAARGGGWRRALGLDRVRRRDWAPSGLGVVLVLAGRNVVALVAGALTGGRALGEASNLDVTRPSPGPVLALAVVAVLLAPVTEELVFRGLLLRSFLRRTSFWPAAVLSTVLFAGLHAYQVRTLAGALTLTSSIAVLGLVNCVLVRVTGRLAPGVLVHATSNALALVAAVALAS